MALSFESFEDVPLPAILLAGGNIRGNARARELFGAGLHAAGGALQGASGEVALETQGGEAFFQTLSGTAKEGPIAWLLPSGGHLELEELKKQDAFKTQFLNMAAHELNTPLTPIRLQHHLLTSEVIGSLNEEQQKSHQVISRNLDRLSSLISDILDVARLESDALKVDLEPMDLVAIVKESLDSYEEPATRVGVKLSWKLPEKAIVLGSETRISQVLDNLIGNAIKFTPEGGKVQVELSGKDEATLSVIDNGVGLTAEQMAKLFRPFSQVHQGDLHGGTGLGLYICKGILEAHGRTIQCESGGQGLGCRFWFSLPLSEEVPVVAPVKKNALADRLRELI